MLSKSVSVRALSQSIRQREQHVPASEPGTRMTNAYAVARDDCPETGGIQRWLYRRPCSTAVVDLIPGPEISGIRER
jgi:hypothetical protein